MAKVSVKDDVTGNTAGITLAFLDVDQVRLIDRALSDVGAFGEVRLIKVKGRLRFVQKIISEEIFSDSSITHG